MSFSFFLLYFFSPLAHAQTPPCLESLVNAFAVVDKAEADGKVVSSLQICRRTTEGYRYQSAVVEEYDGLFAVYGEHEELSDGILRSAGSDFADLDAVLAYMRNEQDKKRRESMQPLLRWGFGVNNLDARGNPSSSTREALQRTATFINEKLGLAEQMLAESNVLVAQVAVATAQTLSPMSLETLPTIAENNLRLVRIRAAFDNRGCDLLLGLHSGAPLRVVRFQFSSGAPLDLFVTHVEQVSDIFWVVTGYKPGTSEVISRRVNLPTLRRSDAPITWVNSEGGIVRLVNPLPGVDLEASLGERSESTKTIPAPCYIAQMARNAIQGERGEVPAAQVINMRSNSPDALEPRVIPGVVPAPTGTGR